MLVRVPMAEDAPIGFALQTLAVHGAEAFQQEDTPAGRQVVLRVDQPFHKPFAQKVHAREREGRVTAREGDAGTREVDQRFPVVFYRYMLQIGC